MKRELDKKGLEVLFCKISFDGSETLTLANRQENTPSHTVSPHTPCPLIGLFYLLLVPSNLACV